MPFNNPNFNTYFMYKDEPQQQHQDQRYEIEQKNSQQRYQPDFDLNLVLHQFQTYQNNESQQEQFYQKEQPPPQPYENLQNSIIPESNEPIFNDMNQYLNNQQSIPFLKDSPPVSPLTNEIYKKSLKRTKSEELGNPINHNPHPGRPRIKSAHNVIEQRYRNKINDKFNSLQESVPTLKILATKKLKEKILMKQQGEEYECSSDEDLDYDIDITQLDENIDLEGLEPARKLNKGTILAKLIEYIKHLELKNQKIKQEHDQLIIKAKLLGIDIDKLEL